MWAHIGQYGPLADARGSKPSKRSPSPSGTEKQKQRIRQIAEELDAHRKRQQQKFPILTLTDMYNVLEKMRGSGQWSVVRWSGGGRREDDRQDGPIDLPLRDRQEGRFPRLHPPPNRQDA